MNKPEDPGELQIVERRITHVTLTAHMLLASRLMAALQEIMDAIPGFDQAPQGSLRFIRRKVGVPQRFVRDAVDAMIAHEELAMVWQMIGPASIDAKQFIDAFGPLKTQLRVAYRGLDVVLKLKEAELTSNGQKVYGIVKELARDSNNTVLETIAQRLRTARRRPRKRRRAKKATKD
jgi:hypothetical protein